MAKDHLLALDQGTSSSRAIVFHRDGRIVAMAQREFRQIYPQPGWVEHDADEIWATQQAVARKRCSRRSSRPPTSPPSASPTSARPRCCGTAAPASRWPTPSSGRTAAPSRFCEQLRAQGLEAQVQHATGLRIDPYFSGTKLRWLLDHVSGAHLAAAQGELAFGTVDTWLLWKLTGGHVHATDVSNASRTMLYDIRHNTWDHELLKALHIPDSVLPQVHPSAHVYGETDAALFGAPIPIAGIAGDQQAALFGQACFKAGLAKNTYGTGCFMLMHTGHHFSDSTNGLLTTAAAQPTTQPEYALEGSVFIGGAVVQWLRDGLQGHRRQRRGAGPGQQRARRGRRDVRAGLHRPGRALLEPDARGAIVGLTRGSTVAHIARAALESIAYQSAALLQAMARDAQPVDELRVDGGASVNDLLMQFQADLLGIPVVRPKVVETTALGAAYLAGLAVGTYRSLDELAAQWQVERRFMPTMSRERAAELMVNWERAVRSTMVS
jgi:glycerol kinase